MTSQTRHLDFEAAILNLMGGHLGFLLLHQKMTLIELKSVKNTRSVVRSARSNISKKLITFLGKNISIREKC